MNLVILGPQGCGKGTQAGLLANDFNLLHVDMGQVLRTVANSQNKFAPTVADTMRAGNLVPDEYIRQIAWDFIKNHDDRHAGFIFEGYPRGLYQYNHLKDMLRQFGKTLDRVILLNISPAESIKRLSNRRTCEKCGQVYSLSDNYPVLGKCIKCQGRLIQREDDRPLAIQRRLELYRLQTQPVFTQAQKEGLAIEINGEQPIAAVHRQLLSCLR